MANAVKPSRGICMLAAMLIGQPIIWMSFHCGLAVAEGASPVAPALVATTHENSVAHFASAIWIIWTTWRGVPALLSCLPFATTQACPHSTHSRHGLSQAGKWVPGIIGYRRPSDFQTFAVFPSSQVYVSQLDRGPKCVPYTPLTLTPRQTFAFTPIHSSP